MEVGGSCWTFIKNLDVHGISARRSHGSRWILLEGLRPLLEVYGTRGSRWEYVGVYGSSWKLPPSVVVEAAIDGSN